MKLSSEEMAELEEFTKRVKAARKEFGDALWRLIECVPADEQRLLTKLRELAVSQKAVQNEELAFHAKRKLRTDTTIPNAVAELSAEELEDEKIQRMIKNNGAHRVQQILLQNRKMAILSKLDHLSVEELEELLAVKTIQADLTRAQNKLAEYERLAIEGKKDRLVQLALSNADLHKVMESRGARISNDQRRSGGPVRRIESGVK